MHCAGYINVHIKRYVADATKLPYELVLLSVIHSVTGVTLSYLV